MQPDLRAGLSVPPGRSGCPINLASELLGNRWSLVILRDLVFGGPRHYRDLLAGSLEGIASNILSARLEKLTAAGLLSKHTDPRHSQKVLYRLTEPAIQLVPVLVALGDWGNRWLPADPDIGATAAALHAGGEALQRRFMDELRSEHLDGIEPGPESLRTSLVGAGSGRD
ncbi:helix-turn-helix transcriptional regulator [Tessaracoccus sp. OS52]|uniref:winged helix-turn-helix transcriptional regulator n=1 Tax=Tessaracoccus sp. OS52 TaxID=2886691 RepID=UPI001D1273C1|nr:helix-turn-helix domain-containing protein [Tessaracoccus sp. OS52]MCC2594281.1 helix-turn-helix transcriptional regulator [Tessaracoccus sp. OS52]